MTEADPEAVITVLLPVKQCPRAYLKESIRSVLSQTSARWQMLLIAERSCFGEVSRTLEELGSDPRIRIMLNEGRRMSGALNTGMRHAETPFVALLLADDMWSAHAVEVLNSYIDDYPGGDFFHSSRRIVDDSGRPLSSVHMAKRISGPGDFVEQTPVKHLLCWRRELALEVGGFDEKVRVGPDDMDFPWSMAEAGARFVTVPECLYVYRDHRQGFRLTTHLPLRVHVRDLKRIFRKHGVRREIRTRWIAEARATYLRQCLYKSRTDRFVKRLTGHEPRHGWRDQYR